MQNDVRPTVRVFRWRIIPVVFLSGFGLLATIAGLLSCYSIWFHAGWPLISGPSFCCLCGLFMGIACILAAIALARGQWRYGCISTAIAVILYAAMPLLFDHFFFSNNTENNAHEKTVAEPTGPNAEEVLKTALETAKYEDKKVLLYIGAPSCKPCRMLGAFFHDNERLFKDDYVVTKIDQADMKMGVALERRLRPERGWMFGGIPWIAILDADGKVLISSDGPKGNIGYPGNPEGIDYFVAMIDKTHKQMSEEQVAAIGRALRENAAKLKKKK
jgi:hypothetical protein